MIRYIVIILVALIGSAHAEEFGECGYIPKRTEQYQYPEWEVLEDCAFYKNGAKLGSDESFYNQIEVERDCCFS